MISNATIVRANNPLNPAHDKQVEQIKPGITIQSWVDDNPSVLSGAVICVFNGEPLLRGQWPNTIIQSDNVVVFLRLPQGGGRGGGKNPLLAVSGLALMTAGALFTGGVMAVSLVGVGAALSIVGACILGVPTIPSTDQANQLAAPSPTYSLSARGNVARLGEAIPVVYGKHLIYLDFATQPYSEYINNEQYLYHLMIIGQGSYELHDVNIDDTAVADFDEVSYQKVEPNGSITLFESNVVTALEVASQELKGPNVDDIYVGPFTINPAETTANKIAIDVVLPRGLYSVNSSGGLDNQSVSFKVEARTVDDDGTSTGSWTVVATETITSNSYDPIRKTYKYDMSTSARYEVRLKRTSNQNSSTSVADEIRWTGAKAYLTDTISYGNVTLIAVKMKATDNLSGRSSRKVNCLVTRKLSKWHPTTGWSSLTATQSVVWAIADILKASYGGNMADSKIDLQGFYDLDVILEARSDYFNAIYDRKMSLWEAIKLACRVARCAGILQGGVFRIIRDRAQTIPVAMFSTRNIVKNSFNIKYAMASEDTVDGVTVEYLNDKTWKPAEVSTNASGTTPSNPAKVKLFGCTSRTQALSEALYLAKNNIYRRVTITFTTDMEGHIPTFGDLVVVSHDMPQWGLSGDVIGVKTDGTIELSEPVTFETGKTYQVAFRKKNGGVNGPFTITAGAKSNEIVLSGTWTFAVAASGEYTTATSSSGDTVRLYYGTKEERSHFSFGENSKWSRYGVVKSIRPRNNYQVQLAIMSEDTRVHTS